MNKKVYRVRAKKLDEQGRGIVSFNHSMIPVPGLLPGELAGICLYRKREETLGRIVEIFEPSNQRVKPLCPHAGVCGGCQLQHMNYEGQLKFKQAQVENLMGHMGHVQPILGMSSPCHYRHKIHATLGYDPKGRVISGIYQEKSHRLLSVKQCLIQDPCADEIMAVIRYWMEKLHIVPYDEDRGRGMMRHVLIRKGYATGQVMVVFVLSAFHFPQGQQLNEALLRAFPQIKTIVYNVNREKTSMVLGAQEKVVYGDGYIEDALCGCKFRISPKSFYQVNPAQTGRLYEKAIEMADLTGRETVLDAYCGTGTIGLIAAKWAASVTGVELNRDAVKDAQMNAKNNRILNADFICQDAGRYMTQMARRGERADVVFMDPPRSGSSREFLDALLLMAPKRIVYISCNPQTQRRDLEWLVKGGYRVRALAPVDLFPMTSGIENIAALER